MTHFGFIGRQINKEIERKDIIQDKLVPERIATQESGGRQGRWSLLRLFSQLNYS